MQNHCEIRSKGDKPVITPIRITFAGGAAVPVVTGPGLTTTVTAARTAAGEYTLTIYSHSTFVGLVTSALARVTSADPVNVVEVAGSRTVVTPYKYTVDIELVDAATAALVPPDATDAVTLLLLERA